MSSKPFPTFDMAGMPDSVVNQLAAGEAVAVVTGGRTSALLVPVRDGDAQAALDAWYRGRGLLALGRMQRRARASGKRVSQREITREISAARRAR